MPCAQIVNEIISNSLKYAFPDNKNGKIEIIFKKIKKNEYYLEVFDNGIGIPENINYKTTKSLGLQLINALSCQLNAAVKVKNQNGTKYMITF